VVGVVIVDPVVDTVIAVLKDIGVEVPEVKH
jgi:hypothetical protein